MQTNPPTPSILDDLVQSCYPAVVRLALSILDDGSGCAPDEAEDVAQEVFISAARRFDAFRGDSSPKTWLFRITINACRMMLRKRRSRRLLQNALEGFTRVFKPPESVERLVEESERSSELMKAVNALDEKHHLALLLRYVHELPVAEIAQVLKISQGTVHSRLHYARTRLARTLKRAAVFEEAA